MICSKDVIGPQIIFGEETYVFLVWGVVCILRKWAYIVEATQEGISVSLLIAQNKIGIKDLEADITEKECDIMAKKADGVALVVKRQFLQEKYGDWWVGSDFWIE